MNLVYRIVFVSIMGAACVACTGLLPSGEHAIAQTRGFQSRSAFHFTVSPDDHWLVYFENLTPEQVGTRDNEYGNLRVLDLRSAALHRMTIAEKQGPEGLTHGDASWAPDSSYCVLPPPDYIRWVPERGILIDFGDPANIAVKTTQVKYGKDRGVEVGGENYALPEHYTCSDCTPHLNDVELMKKHVDAKHLHWGDVPINRNDNAEQIVSSDGTKIYYQKGWQTDEVALYELDIASGKERELTAHKGDCACLDRLRPSPDGKKLAYQLTTGCDFVSMPKVFVIDLVKHNRQEVAIASGGTMHWTSTSDRLYFYRDDYLHVAEFGKGPTSAPAAR